MGEEILKNDAVLAMTGYRPGVYLAGVFVAGVHTSGIFIEKGRFYGKTIAEAMVQRMGTKGTA